MSSCETNSVFLNKGILFFVMYTYYQGTHMEKEKKTSLPLAKQMKESVFTGL